MNRRKFLKMLVLIATALSSLAISSPPLRKKPNIIIILADDAGYADFGYTGVDDYPTPNIDHLAAEGVVCTNGYVTASVCCPSRAGLLTGRYQQRFGHEFNNFSIPQPSYGSEDMGLDLGETTIGDVMHAQGYKTMAVGKWHMGERPKYHPNKRGFDEFYGFLGGGRSYFPYPPGEEPHGSVMRHNNTIVDEMEQIKYATDDMTTEALNFIEMNQDNPFFIYLAYNAVHTPMHAKEEDLEKLEYIKNNRRRIYAAMMVSLDENVERIRDILKKLNLEKDTLLVFDPLRGFKGTRWEGGIRVPFVFVWLGTLPAGVTYGQPVSTLDLLPTSLAVAGGTWTGEKKLDGVNLMPYLQGKDKTPPHEILFWRRGVAAAVRKGKWKLIRSTGNPTLLFDLEKDESETTNLADKHPAVVKELLMALEDWEAELAPPKWKEGKKWENFQIKKHRMEVNTRELERKYP